MDLADSELLERVAAGDRGAFADLYRRYYRRLGRFLRRFTAREEIAEEIINDTMWVVWDKAPLFRGDSQVSTWIMGIACRRALKSLQNVTRVAAMLNSGDRPEELTEDTTEDAEIDRQWLEAALTELPLEQRMALELTYFLGHTCEEIAAMMDCPVNTVKTRLFHARDKLRRRLPVLAGTPLGGLP